MPIPDCHLLILSVDASLALVGASNGLGIAIVRSRRLIENKCMLSQLWSCSVCKHLAVLLGRHENSFFVPPNHVIVKRWQVHINNAMKKILSFEINPHDSWHDGFLIRCSDPVVFTDLNEIQLVANAPQIWLHCAHFTRKSWEVLCNCCGCQVHC